ncbi:Oxysterol-binding protein-related protein 6 [Trichinella papuae]|uniref:Oxysterol-binding protein n=1 Tax=Trichinella papuae TaxID=268474 RepID=A0A0V1MZ00_9BILA|nr:Oxysterol-binding protein-related protein 6 [Trichinella papuae]
MASLKSDSDSSEHLPKKEENNSSTSMQIPIAFFGELYLHKKYLIPRWKRRFFILENGLMKIYRRAADPFLVKREIHVFNLSNCNITYSKPRRRVMLDDGRETVQMKMKNAGRFVNFLHLIFKHQNYAKKLRETQAELLEKIANKDYFPPEEAANSMQTLSARMDQIVIGLQNAAAVTKSLTENYLRCVTRKKNSKRKMPGKLRKLTKKINLKKRVLKSEEIEHLKVGKSGMDEEDAVHEFIFFQNNFIAYAEHFNINAKKYLNQIENEKRHSTEVGMIQPVAFDAEMLNEVSEATTSDEESSDILDEDDCDAADVNKDFVMPDVKPPSRISLPASVQSINISIWNLFRQCIGKSLISISLPVAVFEPLNVLQVLCEEMEYSNLLDQASEEQNPYRRLALVCCFALSRYCNTIYRTGRKPFNPVLGETYEYIRQDLGWKFISEQVSHHPPVSACYADSKSWQMTETLGASAKIWGGSLEIKPDMSLQLFLKKHEEIYTWNKVTTYLHRIISSARYFEHQGLMKVRCYKASGVVAHADVTLRPDSKNTRGDIVGEIFNNENKRVHVLSGNWHQAIYLDSECIWQPTPLYEEADKYYGFSKFVLGLNELTEEMRPQLPPTDTRFRRDQRLVEIGDMDQAAQCKHQIEEFNRDKRKKKALKCEAHIPKWFDKQYNPVTKKIEYVFNGEYWKAREEKFKDVRFEPIW